MSAMWPVEVAGLEAQIGQVGMWGVQSQCLAEGQHCGDHARAVQLALGLGSCRRQVAHEARQVLPRTIHRTLAPHGAMQPSVPIPCGLAMGQ